MWMNLNIKKTYPNGKQRGKESEKKNRIEHRTFKSYGGEKSNDLIYVKLQSAPKKEQDKEEKEVFEE